MSGDGQYRSQSRAIWKKNILRHARAKIRNSAFGWQCLSMKSTGGEATKMSVLFRQNWVITQFRSCSGIFKTIVVVFGTLRPRQNLIIKLTVWSLVFDWSRRTDGILAATWAFVFLRLKAVKKENKQKMASYTKTFHGINHQKQTLLGIKFNFLLDKNKVKTKRWRAWKKVSTRALLWFNTQFSKPTVHKHIMHW